MRGMIIDEAGMETLVSKRFITVAITRKLRQGVGNLFRNCVSVASFAGEI
jgi:hypothetical protein